MIEDLLFLVSFYSNDRDRLKLKLYCHTVYFKFINDFKLCCINNYIISIKILSLTNYHLDWNRGLKYACKSGHHDLVDFMMCSKLGIGANNWNMGLQGACRGGACCAGGHCPHRDLVDFMVEKGANNWDGGLWDACRGGACFGQCPHLDIVKLMIQKGATDWNGGLIAACLGGNIDLVKLMIEKGADDWNWGLEHACWGGACCAGGHCPHRDLVDLLIEYGANNWNLGLMGACEGNRSDIVKLMINKGATRCRYCYRNADDHLF